MLGVLLIMQGGWWTAAVCGFAVVCCYVAVFGYTDALAARREAMPGRPA